MSEKPCYICGSGYTELHHIIKRSEVGVLRNCPLNFIYLCPEHHRGTDGVHGKNGHKLDKKLRLKFQNNLEMLFTSKSISYEVIKEVLEINDKSLRR